MSKIKLPYQADPKGSRYAFVIPNDNDGDLFIKLCEKYLNKETYKLTKRSRGKRVKHSRNDGRGDRGYDQDLPKQYAERFCVYIDSKPNSEHEIKAKRLEDDSRIHALREENYFLKREVSNLLSKLTGIRSYLN